MPLTEMPDLPTRRPRSLLADALVLGGLVLLGLFGSQLLGALLALLVLGDAKALQTALAYPESLGDIGRDLLLGFQGLATLGTFVLPPVLLAWRFQRKSLNTFSPRPVVDGAELLWAAALIPVLAPMLEQTITWNKNLHLPGAFDGFQHWAQAKEDQLAELTRFLIAFSSAGQFALGLLVVAILPAIGEELLFRGTIQPMLQRATGKPHLAIWLTAIFFSAIHVQFFGFVPRMLLGALFGYLYYWSGNIVVPMIAHFVNNGITVTLSYFSQDNPSLDPEALPDAPLYMVVASVVAGGGMLYYFRRRYRQEAHVVSLTLPPTTL